MNKVITINLNGNAYPLEENGYEALRTYLDTAARRLEGNPDRAEIVADIEQAIADKFRAVLGANKSVVVTAEVEQIIAEMGPVEDASAPAPEPPPSAAASPGEATAGPAPEAAAGGPAGPAKRRYRIKDGAMLGGVCNGFAAYFSIDVTLVRVLFAALGVLTWGVVAVPLYVVLLFLLPAAHTSAEKAAAHGAPSTAEEFIRRAREGYYQGLKTFHDKRAHREWRRRFKQEMRGWKRSFRQEMREQAHHWRQGWHHGWAPPPRPHFLSWVLLPFISLAMWVIGLAALVAVLSLLITGGVLGLALPHGVPLWMGIVFLIVAYHVVVWPLKSARYVLFFHGVGGAGYGPSVGGGSLAWLAFLVLVGWVANRHVPEFHQALYSLPPVMHHAVDSLRQWWDQR
jgi:phage shock protein PspC (stress-responsive transcriptional regulator)